jgi:hypothetical protein
MHANTRRDRRMARSIKTADGLDRRIGRLFRVTLPGSRYVGRVGILDAIAADTGTHVLAFKTATGKTRASFAPGELLPFDVALMRDGDR